MLYLGMAKYLYNQKGLHIATSRKHLLRMYPQAITFLICFALFCLIIAVSLLMQASCLARETASFPLNSQQNPKYRKSSSQPWARFKAQNSELDKRLEFRLRTFSGRVSGFTVGYSKQHEDIKSYFYRSLQEYASANGIQSAEFKYFKDKIGEGMFMRGYKNISGQRVIYSTMSVLGDSSILSLRVGALAKDFPPPGFMRPLFSLFDLNSSRSNV